MKTVRKNAKKAIKKIINQAVLIEVFEQSEMDTRHEAVSDAELLDAINSPCWYDGLQILDREDGTFTFTIISRCWNFTVYHSWEAVKNSVTEETYNKYLQQAA